MQSKQTLSSFLVSMYEDKNLFIEINGLKNSMDAKYMLVADALSENIELLEDAVKEEYKLKINKTKDTTYSTKRVAF